jgi:hypothetical protein
MVAGDPKQSYELYGVFDIFRHSPALAGSLVVDPTHTMRGFGTSIRTNPPVRFALYNNRREKAKGKSWPIAISYKL